jgi:hypothetical protein
MADWIRQANRAERSMKPVDLVTARWLCSLI